MESENHTPDTSRVYGILPMFICTSASNERSSQVVKWEIRNSRVLMNAPLVITTRGLLDHCLQAALSPITRHPTKPTPIYVLTWECLFATYTNTLLFCIFITDCFRKKIIYLYFVITHIYINFHTKCVIPFVMDHKLLQYGLVTRWDGGEVMVDGYG